MLLLNLPEIELFSSSTPKMLEVVILFVSFLVCYKLKDSVSDIFHNLQEHYTKWECGKEDGGKIFGDPIPSIDGHHLTDTISLQNRYNRIKTLTRSRSTGSMTILLPNNRPAMRKTSVQHQRERARYSTPTISKTASLAHFKVNPSVTPEPQHRPLVGTCCIKCAPVSRKNFANPIVESLGLRNLLIIPQRIMINGNILQRQIYFLWHVLKTQHKFIYPDPSHRILAHKRVRDAEERAMHQEHEDGESQQNLAELLRKEQKRASLILRGMAARMSHFFLRIASYSIYKVLSQVLDSIQVDKGQVEKIRKAHEKEVPIIYVPLHRSHLDYILLSFILYNYNIRCPYVAAGDNLRLPLLNQFMRGLGAYFIKRKLDPKVGKKDYVYRAILHTYMEQLLRDNNSMEFFIEGGRSRTGKACIPKGGLMSIIVDAFIDGQIDDAMIVPIGISYERLLDGNFINEILGRPKKMESLWSSFASLWKVARSQYGSVRLDFCQPFSLREFINNSQQFAFSKPSLSVGAMIVGASDSEGSRPASPLLRRQSSSMSLYGTDIVIDDQRLLIKGLAEHIVHDAVQATALMSTNIVAFLLLNKHRKGVTLRSLIQSVDWMRDHLKGKNRDVGFTGESVEVIEHAVRLLAPHCVMEEVRGHPVELAARLDMTYITPILSLPGVIELSYYSNVASSAFLTDGIVSLALRSLLGGEEGVASSRGDHEPLTVDRHSLLHKSLILCDVLQYEFIITPPCTSIEMALEDSIERFTTSELLSVASAGPVSSRTEWANRVARNLLANEERDQEEDDDYLEEEEVLEVNLRSLFQDEFQMYRRVIEPYIECYYHLVLVLQSQMVGMQVEEREFIQLMVAHLTQKAAEELLHYNECVSAETIRNGIKLLENWRVLCSFQQDSVKILYLNDAADNHTQLERVLNVFRDYLC